MSIRSSLLSLALLMLSLSQGFARISPELRKAQLQVKQGEQFFLSKRFEMALSTFQRVESLGAALGDHAGILWNIARCYEELRRFPKAIEAFKRYLEVEHTTAGRADGRAKIQSLLPKIFGSLELLCSKGSQAGLKSQALHPCPRLYKQLSPGRYELEAELDGLPYPPQYVEIKAGIHSRLEFPSPAQLSLTALEPGEVFLGERSLGRLPLSLHQLPPGYHQLRVKSLKQPLWERNLRCAPGEMLQLQVRHPERDGPLPWLLSGSAGLAFALGGALLWVAQGNADSADESYREYVQARHPEEIKGLRRNTEAFTETALLQKNMALGSLGLGLLLSGLSIWSFIAEEEQSSAQNRRPPLAWGISF